MIPPELPPVVNIEDRRRLHNTKLIQKQKSPEDRCKELEEEVSRLVVQVVDTSRQVEHLSRVLMKLIRALKNERDTN